jgi:hypothetical protein
LNAEDRPTYTSALSLRLFAGDPADILSDSRDTAMTEKSGYPDFMLETGIAHASGDSLTSRASEGKGR